MSERGYVNLVRHLARPTSSLPLPTLQASIAHYLAHGTPLQPSPTALAAAALSSPLFLPPALPALSALSSALRHAVHLRVALLVETQKQASVLSGVFGADPAREVERWVGDVVKGFRGARAVARLACAGGLLLGLEDQEETLRAHRGRTRGRVEEEVVRALGEVVDGHAGAGGWEEDFRREVSGTGECA